MSNPAYAQVLSILHDSRGWPADCAPAPEATADEPEAEPAKKSRKA